MAGKAEGMAGIDGKPEIDGWDGYGRQKGRFIF